MLLGRDEHIPKVTTEYTVGQGISGFMGEWAYKKYIKMSSGVHKKRELDRWLCRCGTC